MSTTYAQYSRISDLSRRQLLICQDIAYGDHNIFHQKTGRWMAIQDRETIYVFATPMSLKEDDMAEDVFYVEARGDLLGWVHVDDDLLSHPDNIRNLP